MAEAAGNTEGTLELRRLQTLADIGGEHNSTIITMMPIELLQAARKFAEK